MYSKNVSVAYKSNVVRNHSLTNSLRLCFFVMFALALVGASSVGCVVSVVDDALTRAAAGR
jgi:hypothetical protein